MTILTELKTEIDGFLSRITVQEDAVPSYGRSPLNALAEQCRKHSEQISSQVRRIRSVHHFACSGGTLISRCLAAQPSTVLLSEIDPLSNLPLSRVAFAPYDILKQSQTGLRPLSEDGVEETFVAGLKAMHRSVRRRGQRLVLRDHAHSHFCTEIDPASRPGLRDILLREFDVLSIVTVRHPVDSFISLQRNKWVTFTPATFDEYCRRYLVFLDDCAGLPIIRYEDFVFAPDEIARKMIGLLDLSFVENWRELLPAVKVTGDSGRSGSTIEPRERRPLSDSLLQECKYSAAYRELCEKLRYPSDPSVSPFEGR